MKTKSTNGMSNSMVRVALVTTGILLLPLVATQVSSEWDWDLFDFAIIGTLLFSTGCLIELARKKAHDTKLRVALVLGLVLACLCIWAELAVGIFTTWGS